MSKEAILKWLSETAVTVIVIIISVLAIQNTLIAPYNVVGPSMCNTLNFLDDQCQSGKGERIMINVAKYIISDPQYDDIIVFRSPREHKKHLIKRVIGMPGDEIKFSGGKVLRRSAGEKEFTTLEESYLNEENADRTLLPVGAPSVFTVPADHYFALGDNRHSSSDSRNCFAQDASYQCDYLSNEPFVPENLIKGEAWLVFWPISSWRTL